MNEKITKAYSDLHDAPMDHWFDFAALYLGLPRTQEIIEIRSKLADVDDTEQAALRVRLAQIRDEISMNPRCVLFGGWFVFKTEEAASKFIRGYNFESIRDEEFITLF